MFLFGSTGALKSVKNTTRLAILAVFSLHFVVFLVDMSTYKARFIQFLVILNSSSSKNAAKNLQSSLIDLVPP